VDISHHTRVPKRGHSIVNKFSSSVGRVKEVVVCVFGTRAADIGQGVGVYMERKGMNSSSFLPSIHEASLISYWLISNVLGGLGLAKLVDKNKQIMPRVSSIELLPSFTRVISVGDDREGVVP
jgi:hypothetical protein